MAKKKTLYDVFKRATALSFNYPVKNACDGDICTFLKKGNPIEAALIILNDALKNDKGYRLAWNANGIKIKQVKRL